MNSAVNDKPGQGAMKIHGLDFTSAPGPRKPITCAQCHFDGALLHLETFQTYVDFMAFEAFLHKPGPWVAGFDFPFGQPRKLIENLDWPKSWEGYVRHLAGMGKEEFENVIRSYSVQKPAGDKQHRRAADIMARSLSPMKLDFIPVGKMFFQGAARLLNSGGSILPCHPTADTRILLEAYPALVARKLIGKRSYKNDEPRKQTPERQAARQDILRGLHSGLIKEHYGFEVEFSPELGQAFIRDGSGDQLDALLCAIQAAWAWSQREANYGIPAEVDAMEGWIVDPGMMAGGH